MPRDAKGNEIKRGDEVMLRCTVRVANDSEDYCNCIIETVVALYPGFYKPEFAVNSRQVELVSASAGDRPLPAAA